MLLVWLGTEKDNSLAAAVGDGHAKNVRVEVEHPGHVGDVQADMAEAGDSGHQQSLLSGSRRRNARRHCRSSATCGNRPPRFPTGSGWDSLRHESEYGFALGDGRRGDATRDVRLDPLGGDAYGLVAAGFVFA